MTEKRKSDLEHFFRMRKIDANISYEIVGRYDYEGIKEKLRSVIAENKDCLLELTGGKELLLTAVDKLKELQVFAAVEATAHCRQRFVD